MHGSPINSEQNGVPASDGSADFFVPAVVALGANLGARERTLRAALAELERRGFRVRACSSFRETKPVGYLNQPDFINAAALVGVPAKISPENFLRELLAIEKMFGRERPFPNAPRTLDLDLIFFGDTHCALPQLTLPHPRWREREFVITPLREIAAALPACILRELDGLAA